MGRRSLRRIASHVAWQPYLKTVEELPRPWDPAQLFAAPDLPLEVELGSGKGLFMETATGNCPGHNFLGLEVSYKYARFSAARLARHRRTNGCMVHGDGLQVFREVLPDNSATAIHVYFPDPWWKARHRKRRVLRPEFLVDAQRTLMSGGILHFWTDVLEYYESTLEIIATTDLEGPILVAEQDAQHEMDYRTHFERRTRLNDEPVYRAQYRMP